MASRVYAQSATQPITSILRRTEIDATKLETNSDLNTQQRPANAGDAIQIVFADAGDTGGVWLSPPAVRWQFTNSRGYFVDYSICTVLSDGELPAVDIADIYQGSDKAADINATTATKFGQLPPNCAVIQDTQESANAMIPGSFIKSERYTATTGQSGVQYSVQSDYDEDYENIDGQPLSNEAELNNKTPFLPELKGQGEMSFTTRSSNVVSFSATVRGKLLIQGVGNGLDGFSKAIIDAVSPEEYSKLAQRKYFSRVVNASVFWREDRVFTPATSGAGGQYAVTYTDPRILGSGILYPPNRFPYESGNPGAKLEFTTAKAFAQNIVKSISTNSFIGPRDTEKYIGTGTSINVILDDFRVDVTEISLLTYPTLTIPAFNGCGGTFDGLTILGFSASRQIAEFQSTELLESASKAFNQIHVYIRKGILVDRLLDNTRGSSNLFPDLARYLLRLNVLVPNDLINNAQLKAAAEFNNAEQLFFNGMLTTASNLRDYLERVAPFFMLRFVQNNGLFALIPDLPINTSTNKLLNTPVTPVKVFDETNITNDSLERTYIDLADRKPYCAVLLWRDQKSTEPGRVRTVEIRYTGTAPAGPFEQYDMSEFCTSEAHAQKIGKYLLAKRKHTTHTISFRTNPLGGSPASSLLQPGDIIKVRESRVNSVGSTATEENYYQIDSISEDLSGDIAVQATHFPTLSTGASAVTYDVVTGSYDISHGYC